MLYIPTTSAPPGSSESYQIGKLTEAMNQDILHYVPGVSVGFNAIARHDERSGMITPEGHKTVCLFIRDNYLPSLNTGTWKDNTLIISSWNEFSEGTYVSPSNLCGFGYIDNVRSIFTKAPEEHKDELPSEASLNRMNNLYPGKNTLFRLLRKEEKQFEAVEGTAVVKHDFTNAEDRAKWKVFFSITDFNTTGNTLNGTSDSGDYAIRLTSLLGLDLAQHKADILHIRLKTSNIAKAELYFITESDTTWDATKRIVWEHTAKDEFVDYYIDLTQCAEWKGVIRDLRFDPMTVPGNFEIAVFELIESVTAAAHKDIKINGHSLTFDFMPEYNSELDDYFVTANPRLGFFSMLNACYEYNKNNGTLLLESQKGSVLLRIGDSKVSVNGAEKDAGFVLNLRDGLPVFPVKKLAELLGYSFTETENDINIVTSEESSKIAESRTEGAWEFNTANDNEGWSFQNVTGYVNGGKLFCTTTSRDPAIIHKNLEIDTSKYSKMVIGYEYKSDSQGIWAQVFFLAGGNNSYSEEHSVKHTLEASDSAGKYIEVTLDMASNPNWKGTLSALRIDPMNGSGHINIDYIRLEP